MSFTKNPCFASWKQIITDQDMQDNTQFQYKHYYINLTPMKPIKSNLQACFFEIGINSYAKFHADKKWLLNQFSLFYKADI